MHAELIKLMHLADSALPTGGFAFSNGLESMAKTGLIRTTAEFTGHLRASIVQATDFELPMMNGIFNEASREKAITHYDLMVRVPSLRNASEILGRAWLRLFQGMYPLVDTPSIKKTLKACHVPMHFIAAMTMSMKANGHSLITIRQLYLYFILRDQISSAIRLGIIGPSRGHVILAGLTDYVEHHQAATAQRHWEEATRTTALLDVAQIHHPKIYTKLFQN